MKLAITLCIGALLLLLGAAALSCNGGASAELPLAGELSGDPADGAGDGSPAADNGVGADDAAAGEDATADGQPQAGDGAGGAADDVDAPQDAPPADDQVGADNEDDGAFTDSPASGGGGSGSTGGGSAPGAGGSPVVTDGDSDEPAGDSSVGGGGDPVDDGAPGPAAIQGIGDAVISDDGTYRYISGSGVPTHDTGQFPGPGNPNAISAQNYSVRMPLHPTANAAATPYTLPDPFGIGLNGVLFDPYANEFYNRDRFSGWQEEPMPDGLGLDHNHGHVQPNGAYHYHGLPSGLVAQARNNGGVTLVGFAADGSPIYALNGYANALDMGSAVVALRSSYRLKSGTRPSGPGGAYDGTYIQDYEYVAGLGDLDECNGRYGLTAEFPEGTYYYVITADYPYIPRMFRGTPDASFEKGGPPN